MLEKQNGSHVCVCARTFVHNLILATLVPSHLTDRIYITHLNFHYFSWKGFVIGFLPTDSFFLPTRTQEERNTVKLLYHLKQLKPGVVCKFSVLIVLLTFCKKGTILAFLSLHSHICFYKLIFAITIAKFSLRKTGTTVLKCK